MLKKDIAMYVYMDILKITDALFKQNLLAFADIFVTFPEKNM